MIGYFVSAFLSWLGRPLVQETLQGYGSFEERVRRGVSAYMLLFLVPLALVFYLVIRSVYNATIGKRRRTSMLEDFRREALRLEKAGELVSAGYIYEKNLNDLEKAASLYETGKDFGRAALVYEMLGRPDKTKEMYEQASDLVSAAEVSFRQGELEEAARLYERAGKKLDAAETLERAGRKLAAVRLYREAGAFKKAAALLQEEGRYKDAADMFGISLADRVPEPENLDDFYTYAVMLEKAGAEKRALEAFSAIHRADPDYRDVGERVKALPAQTLEEEPPLERGSTTLRKIMAHGRIEARFSMRLWVQILKALAESHRRGRPFGLLSPEIIVVDANNSVSFLDRPPNAGYEAPETAGGLQPDARSDIYSMGVILFEMLTGGIENAGFKRADELAEDVPEWLEGMIVKCLKKVGEDRYQSVEEIFRDLKTLSKSRE